MHAPNLNRNRAAGLFAASALISLLLALPTRALEVIDPTGTTYTDVSANSEYNGDFAGTKLFNADVTGIPSGTVLSGNADWARVGGEPGFVAFQVDQTYTVGSVYYAQRVGANPTADKITKMSVWASATTPFTAADPGTAPDTILPITQSAGALWMEYLLTNTITGRYFLIKVEQIPLVSGANNIGGNEFRLGSAGLGEPPGVAQQPAGKTLYAGGTARLGVQAVGAVPLSYQWKKGSTPLSDGPQISGATTPNLVISGVVLADAGNYSCTITNSVSVTNTDPATLAVLPTPTSGVASVILSNSPVAYWRLNEPAVTPKAADNFGSYDGNYGTASASGDGPQAPIFPGFESANTALQTTGFTIESAVALPGLNLNTNTVTIVAWVYPDGEQQPYTGIVFNRTPGTVSGLMYSGDTTKLAYHWNGDRYAWDSGLLIPPGEWTMVAMVVTPAGATLYAGTTNTLRFRTDTFAQAIQSFAGVTYIGLDTDVGGSARTFNGRIDDVAIFNRSISQTEIEAIFSAGSGALIPVAAEITDEPKDQALFAGERLELSPLIGGTSSSYFQWYKSDSPISGAQSRVFSVSSVTTADAGEYFLIASNQVNAVTSRVAHVTVSSEILRVLSPSGTLYTGISASSEFPGGGYGPANLFTTDVTGVPLGSQLSGGDWADDGASVALGPAYVAFQVDQVFTVRAMYYAQRAGAFGGATDKITQMSVWASETSAFDPLNPPADPAGAVVLVPDLDAATWHRYILPTTVTGKFFLVKVEQDPVAQYSNIGGNELRLGVLVTPQPLQWSWSSSGLTLRWSLGTLLQADQVNGPWVPADGVSSGVPIPATATKRFYRVQY